MSNCTCANREYAVCVDCGGKISTFADKQRHGESKSEYKWADADELLAVELVGVNLGIVSDDIADAIKKVAVEAFNAARERKEG